MVYLGRNNFPEAPMTSRELLWGPPAGARRGPKPRYTLDAIAEAAMTIADDEGLDAVTMQRVAERLGTTKMALYRYVPGRAELDAVMLDRALGLPPAASPGGWRSGLTSWAEAVHGRTLVRPWAVELAQRPHVPGPGELAWYERGLGAMAGLPLSGGEKLDVLALLVGHVMSIVRQEAAASAPEADLASGLVPILAERGAEYPLTSAAFAEAAALHEHGVALPFGIARIVDGIAALIDAREGTAE
jgi:AcrR family transcriptional regulator